jgi:hypothetical protein
MNALCCAFFFLPNYMDKSNLCMLIMHEVNTIEKSVLKGGCEIG